MGRCSSRTSSDDPVCCFQNDLLTVPPRRCARTNWPPPPRRFQRQALRHSEEDEGVLAESQSMAERTYHEAMNAVFMKLGFLAYNTQQGVLLAVYARKEGVRYDS